jgi:hypothetical protein
VVSKFASLLCPHTNKQTNKQLCCDGCVGAGLMAQVAVMQIDSAVSITLVCTTVGEPSLGGEGTGREGRTVSKHLTPFASGSCSRRCVLRNQKCSCPPTRSRQDTD